MPDLPSGTVTFLFTDIEGSTALWERDRAAMAAAVERHLSLLRQAIESHDGVPFKTIGDAMQAAFPTAPDALVAAIDGQRAIITEPWPEAIGSLRVRMALHAGTAAPIAGDYLAPALNRLSRTLGTGHGDQILVTDTVRGLLAGQLPPGVTLRSLGRHALRDLQEPEDIFQLVAPGLPDQFPALRSLPHHPTNLTIPPTMLIGRDDELAAVKRMFRAEGARLVTLTGPGGSGKTRLAREIAAELRDSFPDGVFFVDLTAVREPELVLPRIASVLKVRERPTEALRETVTAYLTSMRMLLVLDNCEQVIEAAPDIAELLAACPRLAILATSREPLRVRVEQEYPVLPLALPDDERAELTELAQVPAIALFVARASASNPRFVLTEENAAAIAEICRRLDGLPLAIELAAARTRLLPPRAMLARLERRLPLLTQGARDLPARQRTLRDTIAWSHDLLDDAEQELFQFLSVFPHGFALEAAEWVSSGASPDVEMASGRNGESPPATPRALSSDRPGTPVPSPDTRNAMLSPLELLDSLVAKSLVTYESDQDDSPRYRMLDTIREFGLERLAASGREAEARQRHAAWALALAERAGPHVKGPEATTWLEMLERDHASLRVALNWLVERDDGQRLARMAGVLWSFWQEHAHYSEGRRWLAAALELGRSAPAADRLRVLTGSGVLAWYQADVAYSRQMHERALALAREIGDRKAEAFELGSLAVHAGELGDHQLAAARYEESLTVARAEGEAGPVVLALHNLAHHEWERGEPALARRRLEEALAVAREGHMGWILPSILVGLGTAATDLGDAARAIEFFRESIALAQTRGNLGDVIDGIGGLARVAAVTGRAKEAVRLFAATDAMREALAVPLAPSEQAYVEPIMNGLRETLGAAGFAAAWAAGRLLTQDESLAEALAVRAEPEPATERRPPRTA